MEIFGEVVGGVTTHDLDVGGGEVGEADPDWGAFGVDGRALDIFNG